MKKKFLILLIGPCGAGKSTYCKEHIHGDYVRISQDEQGKEQHYDLFLKTVKEGKDIVVDRMNFDREQRSRYTNVAKENGYEILFVMFTTSLAESRSRAINRINHPTIQDNDSETVDKVLQMYWSKFEYPKPGEYNFMMNYPPTSDVRTPTFRSLCEEYYMGFRFIVVGDIHGCFDELWALLAKVNYDPKFDILVSCGDLVDRGPKINEVLRFFREQKAYAVLGNHDNKFLRYLLGNKVQTDSLRETINQTINEDKKTLISQFMNMSYVLQFGPHFVTHAGFHPNIHPENQGREFSMYARKFDSSTGCFTNDNTKPYWYEFDRNDKDKKIFFFGHEIHEDICQVRDNIYALDGGCYLGGKLRCAVVHRDNPIEIVEVDSRQPRLPRKNETTKWDHMNKFEPYDNLVELGYLNKQEKGDLVLYNYTEKCTFDKLWNSYTLECRGLIMNKATGDTVARPFPKFFNLGEHQSTILKNLPNSPYSCYEKLDGSLGILYFDPEDSYWKIATRGSFKSDQAIKASDMFYKHWSSSYDKPAYLVWSKYLPTYHDYTLLFEIIYPANRVNPGARLVVDYGSTETLVLLGAVHRVTGQDIPEEELQVIAKALDYSIAKKYDYTIEQMIELQKTLPSTAEGFVVKFDTGLRIKIKGDEYCKMQRILNSITPIFLWELMKDTEEFVLTDAYKMSIPEEILSEAEEIEQQLKASFEKVKQEIKDEYYFWLNYVGKKDIAEGMTWEKSLGLWVQSGKVRHGSAMFNYANKKIDKVRKYVSNVIRPTGNVLKGGE